MTSIQDEVFEIGICSHELEHLSDPDRGVFLSIIIPSYNRSIQLLETVKSIIKLNVSLEIIIVDDGSTDDTEKSIKSLNDDRVKYFKIQNSERGAARNYGLRQALGTYVNFFDSDDLYLPTVSKLMDFLRKCQPDVVYGNIEHEGDSRREIHSGNFPYKTFTKNLLHNNFLACGSVFLKRQIALHFLFHEDRRLSSAEDWELWLRINSRYAFTHFKQSIFKQIHHQYRSLSTIKANQVEIRDEYFAQLVLQNIDLRKFYGNQAINLFVADRFTFIALTWCGVNKGKTYLYWRKAVRTSIYVLRRKRFWAILKKMILS